MAARRHAISASPPRFSQLWQFPLLLFSLALFGYAAYLFFDPKPGLTADDQVDVGRILLAHDRPEAAREHLNRVLQNERLNVQQQGQVHLLLAQALADEQRQKKLNIPANHERIIEQTRLATGRGIVLDAAGLSRIGESYEALGKYTEAIASYRSAAALDEERSLRLQRRVIDLQQLADDPAGANATLEQYLKDPRLTDAEKAWAMGEQSHLLVEAGKFSEARALLDEAMRMELDPVARGALRYRLGYCAWKLGDEEEAERLLRVAREEIQAKHPLDADASYVLGRIAQDRDEAQQAASFYQIVLTSHPDSRVAPLARMGRAICRIMLRQEEPALADLQHLVREIQTKASRARLKGDVLEGLRLATAGLASRENYAGALETMGYEQELNPQPPPNFYARLGELYEKRAEQIEKLAAVAPPAELIRRQQLAREAMTRAADAYVTYSRAQTISDDRSHGTAMWRGIELYDKAGNTLAVISTLQLFVTERPDDPITPDALLRLGRAYQASGQFDDAIAAFTRNTARYSQSLAAIKSAVPLAEAYIAKGPESFGKAEKVLLGVVTNNEMITPDSQEFRLALFDLGQLYHRTARYEAAVGQLEEFHKRYPADERTGDVFFLMADSYRKSAARIEALRETDTTSARDAVASASVSPADDGSGISADALPVDPIEAERERRTRLERARELYDKVIERWRGKTPDSDFDKLQLKLAYFYRADCVFDLGRHAEAIDLYEAATFKYQNDSMSLTALMQIVSAYVQTNKMDQARAAAERAKYLYRRMPDTAFTEGPYAQPRQYWEQQIKWMGEAGLW